MSTPILVKGRPVGILNEQRVFVTQRGTKHFFRIYKGYGISYSVLRQLRALDCQKIAILLKDSEQTQIYHATVQDFLEKGYIYCFKGDYQRILPTEHMRLQL
jgi:ketol-acid reductoisomerase